MVRYLLHLPPILRRYEGPGIRSFQVTLFIFPATFCGVVWARLDLTHLHLLRILNFLEGELESGRFRDELYGACALPDRFVHWEVCDVSDSHGEARGYGFRDWDCGD